MQNKLQYDHGDAATGFGSLFGLLLMLSGGFAALRALWLFATQLAIDARYTATAAIALFAVGHFLYQKSLRPCRNLLPPDESE